MAYNSGGYFSGANPAHTIGSQFQSGFANSPYSYGNPSDPRSMGMGVVDWYNQAGLMGQGADIYKALLQGDASAQSSANQLAIAKMNLPTAAQLALSYRGFQPANRFYNQTMQDGGYSPEARQSILSAAYGNINNSARAMQQTINDQSAQRGLGGNPYAMNALGMQGHFAASGARGQALAGLEQNAIQNRMGAAQGASGNAAAMGALAMKPIQDPQNMTLYGDSGELDESSRRPRNPYNDTMGRPSGGGRGTGGQVYGSAGDAWSSWNRR